MQLAKMLVAACKINSVKDYKQISPNNKLKSREKRKERICVITSKASKKEKKRELTHVFIFFSTDINVCQKFYCFITFTMIYDMP